MIISEVFLGFILIPSLFLSVLADSDENLITPRIVGGTIATRGRFPYYIHLSITRSGSSSRCGATLIAADFALTAAHCVKSTSAGRIDAYVNAYRSSGSVNEYPRQVITAWIHPAYDEEEMEYDVALLKLDSPVPEIIRPVRLNGRRNRPFDGQEVSVFGLGMTSETGSASKLLREVDVNVVSWEDCNDRNSYFNFINDDLMICAGVDGGGKDSCQGDSGGPLIIRAHNEDPAEDLQVGIASFGTGCARPNKPGGYARVSASLNWIESIVCSQSSDAQELCAVPTRDPTPSPTRPPTRSPTHSPTQMPTPSPTRAPTRSPTSNPTHQPTPEPTASPTPLPTPLPTMNPTQLPTFFPTPLPTSPLTPIPSTLATEGPTSLPIENFTPSQIGISSRVTPMPINWFEAATGRKYDDASTSTMMRTSFFVYCFCMSLCLILL